MAEFAGLDRDLAELDQLGLVPARVCIATNNITGMTRNGVGTAHASLALYLAAMGHQVTIAYTGEHQDPAVVADFRKLFEPHGVRIELVGNPEYAKGRRLPDIERAVELLAWLRPREGDFDVVHLTECQAHGYYCLQAKRCGMAFRGITFVVTPHGSLRWCFEGAEEPLCWNSSLALDVAEAHCLRLADVVIGPSRYMLGWVADQGWQVPARTFVQQYPLPVDPLALTRPAPAASPIDAPAEATRELVFFGRLETRKGLLDFLDAIDLLQGTLPGHVKITFLGEPGMALDGLHASDYVRKRAAAWQQESAILDDYGHAKAIAYIREPGRLPVMASTMDNLPNTILECLEMRVPFLASRAGGIPEMIHQDDLEACTFDACDPEMLARRLADACMHRSLPVVPRFAIDPWANAARLDQWHRRAAAHSRASAQTPAPGVPDAPLVSLTVLVAEGGAEEDPGVQASLASLDAAGTGGWEVRLVPARATAESTASSPDGFQTHGKGPLGTRLARAVAEAPGTHILLLEAGVTLYPGAVARLREVVGNLAPDILTFPLHSGTFIETEGQPPRLPLGVTPVHLAPLLAVSGDYFGRCPVVEKNRLAAWLVPLRRCDDWRGLIAGLHRVAANAACRHEVFPDTPGAMGPAMLEKEPKHALWGDIGPFDGRGNFATMPHETRIWCHRWNYSVHLAFHGSIRLAEERLKEKDRKLADYSRKNARRLEAIAARMERFLATSGALRSAAGIVFGPKKEIRQAARDMQQSLREVKKEHAKELSRAQKFAAKTGTGAPTS